MVMAIMAWRPEWTISFVTGRGCVTPVYGSVASTRSPTATRSIGIFLPSPSSTRVCPVKLFPLHDSALSAPVSPATVPARFGGQISSLGGNLAAKVYRAIRGDVQSGGSAVGG